MNSQELQARIDELYYWDSRVLELSASAFMDEAKLVYQDDDGDVEYRFLGCYKVIADHSIGYPKIMPYRELEFKQIPFFMHDVEVTTLKTEEEELIVCKIQMHPMNLEIWCKEMEVGRQK